MTYIAEFHGGPRDGTRRDIDEVQVQIYVDDDELPDGGAVHFKPVQPGQPYPTLPNVRYELRSGSADPLHYDWCED